MEFGLRLRLVIVYHKQRTIPVVYFPSWQSAPRWGMFSRRSLGLRRGCFRDPWGSWSASWAWGCHCGSCSLTSRRLLLLLEAHWHLTTDWLILFRVSSLYTLLTLRPWVHMPANANLPNFLFGQGRKEFKRARKGWNRLLLHIWQ